MESSYLPLGREISENCIFSTYFTSENRSEHGTREVHVFCIFHLTLKRNEKLNENYLGININSVISKFPKSDNED